MPHHDDYSIGDSRVFKSNERDSPEAPGAEKRLCLEILGLETVIGFADKSEDKGSDGSINTIFTSSASYD